MLATQPFSNCILLYFAPLRLFGNSGSIVIEFLSVCIRIELQPHSAAYHTRIAVWGVSEYDWNLYA